MNAAIEERTGYVWVITVISIVVPLAVALLIFMPARLETGDWVKFLPHLNAAINTSTSLLLLLGLYFIKRNKIAYHKAVMLAAFGLGFLFLVSYIVYHASVPSAIFGDADGNGVLSDAESASLGSLRTIYLVTLLSHIGLSIVVVPFVLMALYFGLTNQYDRHRKIVRYGFPIWLFVSVSGVVVYLMISPFYR